MRIALLLLGLLLVVGAASAAPAAILSLPYGVLVDRAGRVFVADAGRHQVLRYDARRRQLVAVAGSGTAGSTGDGGPALRARLDEVVGLAEDRAGRLYVSDLRSGAVRRFRIGGTIETVARVAAPTGIDLDPTGRYLAIASIERGVLRLDLGSGALTTLVAVGHGVDGPHGLAYDAAGDLWVGDPPRHILRIDGRSGAITVVAQVGTANVLPTPAGVYFTDGGPSGGRVRLLSRSGAIRTIAGTGRISRHRDGVPATRVGILPSGIALARDGSLLVAQARPIPALRRINRAGIISTLAR
jgi:DNA-binding beta-propeller fold protein YncE